MFGCLLGGGSSMQIFVVTPCGRFVREALGCWTLAELLASVDSQCAIDAFCCWHDGRRVNNERLGRLGVRHGAVVTFCARLRGGMPIRKMVGPHRKAKLPKRNKPLGDQRKNAQQLASIPGADISRKHAISQKLAKFTSQLAMNHQGVALRICFDAWKIRSDTSILGRGRRDAAQRWKTSCPLCERLQDDWVAGKRSTGHSSDAMGATRTQIEAVHRAVQGVHSFDRSSTTLPERPALFSGSLCEEDGKSGQMIRLAQDGRLLSLNVSLSSPALGTAGAEADGRPPVSVCPKCRAPCFGQMYCDRCFAAVRAVKRRVFPQSGVPPLHVPRLAAPRIPHGIEHLLRQSTAAPHNLEKGDWLPAFNQRSGQSCWWNPESGQMAWDDPLAPYRDAMRRDAEKERKKQQLMQLARVLS
mmetsp:Transcript_45816/g.121082  ORF Transcript_45816/g.121082 Transcript_45816/m.121082 type:complete len:414 (+) Transcript_45816:32-1273(+)